MVYTLVNNLDWEDGMARKAKRKVTAAKRKVPVAKKPSASALRHQEILDKLDRRLMAYDTIIGTLEGRLNTILRILQDPVERTDRRMAAYYKSALDHAQMEIQHLRARDDPKCDP
jgi:hypothetical protein